jgi:hypothetical protein
VRISLPNQFFMWHVMGNIQMDVVTSIRNTGGRDVFISRVACAVLDDEDRLWQLPAQTYLETGTPQPGIAPPEIALSGIPIGPDQYWSRTLRCYQQLTDAEQDELEQIFDQFLAAGISDYTPDSQDGKPPEVEPKLCESAVEYFKRRFLLCRGRYRLLVSAISQSRKGKDDVVGVAGYEFTLYESNIQKLTSIVDRYRFGFGVTRNFTDPLMPGATWIRTKPLRDSEARRIYEVHVLPRLTASTLLTGVRSKR